MKKYVAKQDIIWGVLPNTNGQPNILFRKGDQIIGQQVERFIANKNTKGIEAKPTVASARVETANGLAFVPFSQIDIIVDNSPKGVEAPIGRMDETNKNTENRKDLFTTKNIIIGVVGIAVVFGLLKVSKVI
jgi:hypothetical protein